MLANSIDYFLMRGDHSPSIIGGLDMAGERDVESLCLKPLEPALKDNDIVRAVIRGSGINQDGKTPGITMPNGSAQGMTLLIMEFP
jgi:hypothetical protein